MHPGAWAHSKIPQCSCDLACSNLLHPLHQTSKRENRTDRPGMPISTQKRCRPKNTTTKTAYRYLVTSDKYQVTIWHKFHYYCGGKQLPTRIPGIGVRVRQWNTVFFSINSVRTGSNISAKNADRNIYSSLTSLTSY